MIHEPADGEVMWTEDVGANFDIFIEIHGGGFNYWDRGARIEADVFVGLQNWICGCRTKPPTIKLNYLLTCLSVSRLDLWL